MSANRLTRLRTGAASALATKHLARRDARSFGLVGAGVQGRGQLEAIWVTMKPKLVLVYDHEQSESRRSSRSTRAPSSAWKPKRWIRLTRPPPQTWSAPRRPQRAPVLTLANVRQGTHVNAIGSNIPARRELGPDLLKESKVVVDFRDQAVQESGDLEPIRKKELPQRPSTPSWLKFSWYKARANRGLRDHDFQVRRNSAAGYRDGKLTLRPGAVDKGVGTEFKLSE